MTGEVGEEAKEIFKSGKWLKIASFYVDMDEFEKLEKLGEGGFATVWKCKSVKTGKIVARKKVKWSSNEYWANAYEREVGIMGNVRHPALLELVGCTPWSSGTPMILTPFMPNGSVDDMIKKEIAKQPHPEWTPIRKHIVLYGTACGMAYMHKLRLIHRDMKPANILLDENFEPKIADFGLSKYVETGKTNELTMNNGTVIYMAPEFFKADKIGFKVDVYAFGMTMYSILSGRPPYNPKANQWMIMQMVDKGERPELKDVPVAYQSLIEDCWHEQPDSRPGFDEIVERLKQLIPPNEPDSNKLYAYEEKMNEKRGTRELNPDVDIPKEVNVKLTRSSGPEYHMSQDVARSSPPIVMDVGSYTTKFGYANNLRPNFVIPTVIGNYDPNSGARFGYMGPETGDLDFYIGYEATEHGSFYHNTSILKDGEVQDWNKMEQFWEQCLFKYLRCDPEDHAVLLTEPLLNPPDNREFTAEIMFETFNVPYLYISPAAILTLWASWSNKGYRSMTGTVIDVGNDGTWIVPIVHGYMVGNAIEHMPVGGRAITEFIAGLLKDHEPTIPLEYLFETATAVKERFCKVARCLSPTFQIFDRDRNKFLERYTGITRKAGKEFTCEVLHERFLAPEVLFSPELVSSEHTTPLAVLVDRAIRRCSITDRKSLYSNIVLGGGSTAFPGIGKRLQTSVQKIVDEELSLNAERVSKGLGKNIQASKVDVRVDEHKRQSYAAWYGGAMIADSGRAFYDLCMTKAEYDEVGFWAGRRGQRPVRCSFSRNSFGGF